jgi:hypothetical protein
VHVIVSPNAASSSRRSTSQRSGQAIALRALSQSVWRRLVAHSGLLKREPVGSCELVETCRKLFVEEFGDDWSHRFA